MKPAITLLASMLAAGLASAQSPSMTVIQNTRASMSGVHSNTAATSNATVSVRDRVPSAAKPTPAPAKTGAAVAAPVRASAPSAARKRPSKVRAGKLVPVAAPVPAPPPKEDKPLMGPVPGNSAATSETAQRAPVEEVTETDKWNATGKRDPFISPVISRSGGSGCSTGKKCLEIGAINLQGIVHTENGFIAVVSNDLRKAYFLHENDPVFNGYVMKITNDSIVFEETLQDRLGKTFTREVVKKLMVPAV